MNENPELRRLVSDTADQLVAELFNDDKIQERLNTFKAQPDQSLENQYSFLLTENRTFSEELIYRLIEKLDNEGFLNKK